MSIFGKVNRAIVGAAVLGACSVPAFAEGTIQAADLDTVLSTLQSDATSLLGKIATVVAAVIGAGFVIWGLMLAWRKVKAGGNKA